MKNKKKKPFRGSGSGLSPLVGKAFQLAVPVPDPIGSPFGGDRGAAPADFHRPGAPNSRLELPPFSLSVCPYQPWPGLAWTASGRPQRSQAEAEASWAGRARIMASTGWLLMHRPIGSSRATQVVASGRRDGDGEGMELMLNKEDVLDIALDILTGLDM
ncbi:hypothetical protein TgHK011_008971 [Trichoderma gracile]|nr:hypothetical protein TgHK011_008971 [Trichoderma gracile]